MGKGASKGPSAAELQKIAQAEAKAEMEKLKATQDFEREKMNQQLAFEKEVAAQKMNELKLQGELQTKAYQDQLAKEAADEAKKLQEEKAQEELQKQLEADAATRQSELNSNQLSEDLARRKTYLESFWYLDNDSSTDVSNETTSTKRKNVSKAY